MPSNALIQSATLERALDFGRDLGLDPSGFLSARQADLAPLSPDRRVPNALFADFLVYAAEALNEPHFGLKAGAAFHPSDLGAFGYLLMNAPTVGEGLAEAERLFAYQQDGGFFRAFRDVPGEIALVYDGGELSGRAARQDAECGLAIIEANNARLCGRRARPRLVRIRALAIKGDRSLETHFGCPVDYDAPENALVYDDALLGEPVRGADPRLFRILSEFIAREIADFPDREDVVAETRWRVRRRLAEGAARLEAIAREMGESPRSLQRRLQGRETRFSEIVNAVRIEALAQDQGAATGRALAFRLGFADESAFYKWKRRQAAGKAV